ncbi:hypothetical protein OIU77_007657 [Salix suchowensis]|uniref:SOUL heme-binding family protein n=1 Tax=Salix suchowensis TaxID=1278906 RepID=A0ABQ9AIZ8_9ROSI|nr:hypothetical protein OIU77_007657 [Salix suchowensis]
MEKPRLWFFLLPGIVVLNLVCLCKAIESPQYEVVHAESDFEVTPILKNSMNFICISSLMLRLLREKLDSLKTLVSWLDDEDESAILASLLTQSHSSPHFGASHRPQSNSSIVLGGQGGGGNNRAFRNNIKKHDSCFLEAEWLFQYIQGANLNYSRIAMTAPVVTSIIPGAGPFQSSAYAVRFYLPVKFQADPPAPLDELHLKPYMWNSRCVAVRKFHGYAKDENVAGEAKRLAVSLSRSPWFNSTSTESNYSYSIAQYDSPFHFIGRANEVWADIKAPGANGCESSGVASY